MPEPEAITIKLCSQSFMDRIRTAIGPGMERRPQSISDKTIQAIAGEWLGMGATEDDIVAVVRRQTELWRENPIRSLRALADDVAFAIEARKPPLIDPRPAPAPRPPGKAGECLEAIVQTHGEVITAAWFTDAEWTDTEVLLPTQFMLDNVWRRFRGVLERHGFTAALRSRGQKTA